MNDLDALWAFLAAGAVTLVLTPLAGRVARRVGAIDRPRERSLGAGEATTGPTPAAIANAIFFATGKRIRSTPFRSHDLSWA